MSDTALSVEDRLDIHDLLSRYCHLWDAGDGENWSALFTGDAGCAVPGVVLKGTEQLRDMVVNGAAAGEGKFRHQITNILSTPQADGQVAVRAYGLMTDWRQGGQFVMLATYNIKLVRTDGGWKIADLVAERA